MSLVFPYALVPSVSHITPFTVRDGATYLELLEAIRAYVVEVGVVVADIEEALNTVSTNTYAQVFSYKYGSSVPATGTVYTNAWSMGATEIRINETTDDGAILSFGVLASAKTAEIRLVTTDGKILRATITGPAVDNGAYRTIPIAPIQVIGTVPGATAITNVAVVVSL